jgi:hypothetical protein
VTVDDPGTEWKVPIMDEQYVAALAARHRRVRAIALAETTEGQSALPSWLELTERCWTRLATEANAFCEAYNRGFPADRIHCQPHTDTIVIRCAEDPQETLTFVRATYPANLTSWLSVHRYSSHAVPATTALETCFGPEGTLLRISGDEVTLERGVLTLLEAFTESLLRSSAGRT